MNFPTKEWKMKDPLYRTLDGKTDEFVPKFQKGDLVRLKNNSKKWKLPLMQHLDDTIALVEVSSYCDPLHGYVFQIRDKKTSIIFTISDIDAEIAENSIKAKIKEEFF